MKTFCCDYCGNECSDEFGDVEGAIVCPDCLGWYGSEPDPEVAHLLQQMEQEQMTDKEAVWPPVSCTRSNHD